MLIVLSFGYSEVFKRNPENSQRKMALPKYRQASMVMYQFYEAKVKIFEILKSSLISTF